MSLDTTNNLELTRNETEQKLRYRAFNEKIRGIIGICTVREDTELASFSPEFTPALHLSFKL